MKKNGFRKQHNISLTTEQEDVLQRVRVKHPRISLADMVMATAKALDTPEPAAQETVQEEE